MMHQSISWTLPNDWQDLVIRSGLGSSLSPAPTLRPPDHSTARSWTGVRSAEGSEPSPEPPRGEELRGILQVLLERIHALARCDEILLVDAEGTPLLQRIYSVSDAPRGTSLPKLLRTVVAASGTECGGLLSLVLGQGRALHCISTDSPWGTMTIALLGQELEESTLHRLRLILERSVQPGAP